MKKGPIACVLFVFAHVSILPGQAWCGGAKLETQVPAAVTAELQHLLGFVGHGREDPAGFKPERISDVIGFVDGAKDANRLYHAGSPKGVASAYYEVDLSRDMDHVLRMTYSTEIPEVFTAPSTLRSAEWTRIDRPHRQLPNLWQPTGDQASPVFLTGIQHLVNTPDQTTGAYYGYDLYRTVILTTFKGRRLFLSLSKQTGVSEVGRKGLIVGPDDCWDYLYTGAQGLSRFGIGWAKTYMYDSYSAAFYLESSGGPASKVRFGVFKWLAAGWADVNIVKAAHIHAGLQRYALTYKRILEHPRLSDPTALEKSFAAIRALPDDRLREIAGNYVAQLGRQVRAGNLLSQDEAMDLFDKGGYLRAMNRQEMESIVTCEYLKQLLGKPHQVDVVQWLGRR